MEHLDHIPLEQCEKGWLYWSPCRNASYGVYDGEGGFIISRFKLYPPTFLATELHWDASEHNGTCTPLLRLKKLPADIEPVLYVGKERNEYNENLLEWIETQVTHYKAIIKELA